MTVSSTASAVPKVEAEVRVKVLAKISG